MLREIIESIVQEQDGSIGWTDNSDGSKSVNVGKKLDGKQLKITVTVSKTKDGYKVVASPFGLRPKIKDIVMKDYPTAEYPGALKNDYWKTGKDGNMTFSTFTTSDTNLLYDRLSSAFGLNMHVSSLPK